MRSFAARLAVLCVLFVSSLGAGGRASDFGPFLDRMRAASGPVWRTHIVSISRLDVDGTMTLVSGDGEDIRFAVRHCIGELCRGTYFDGQRLYAINENDTALPESHDAEPYLRSLRLVASLAFLAPSFKAQGGRVDDGGTVKFAGASYRMLFVIDPQAIPMRVYVDPKTALVRYARDINGEDTFEYRNYRTVEGFTLPFEVLHNGKTLERYDDRTPVASAFHAPHGLVPVFSGEPQTIATDPQHVTPVFDCQVGGVTARCLLDSGNSGLSMSSELASRLDATVIGTFNVSGLGGYDTQVVRAGPLHVGNATYPSANYVVLNDVRRYGYDVVLGADVLASTAVDIDNAAHTIRFAAQPMSGATITLPLSFENFIPVVSIDLGTLTARLAVDTGDESSINLAYSFYAKHPGLFTATQRRVVSGIGGASIEMIGNIPHVTLGEYQTGPQQIGYTQMLKGTAFGHLGAAFLQQFKVQLDYSAEELHLEPQP